MNKRGFYFSFLIYFWFFVSVSIPLFCQQLGVQVALEKDQVFTGESFIYQITVNGSDNPEQPVLQGFADFDVAFLGGRNSSRQSLTIVNGQQLKREESKSYIFQYSLTPKKAGRLIIPAVTVKAEGKILKTNPLPVIVREPTETADYKLRLELSGTACYTGEPVICTLTWYIMGTLETIGKAAFNVPLLDDKRFTFRELNRGKVSGSKYIPIVVNNNSQLEFENPAGTTRYQGKDYTTLSFKKVLIPQTGGQFSLAKATVQFTAIAGYREGEDWFGDRTREPYYGNFVISSNSLVLDVRDVPTAGKPPNYSGIISDKLIVEVSAAPVEVKVGDPITLQMAVSGPEFPDNIKIPDLNTIRVLTDSFKIPVDQSPGKVEGDKKLFTQTLRAYREDVTSIPEFEIPYFNTTLGKYEFVKSRAIPLKVTAGEFKTFLDLEGITPVEAKNALEASAAGIAHNYEGRELLQNQGVSLLAIVYHPLFLFMLALPVLAFLVLLFITRFSHIIKVDDTDRKVKASYHRLMQRVHNRDKVKSGLPESGIFGILIEEINQYIGSKLKTGNAALTFKDVETPLRNRAVPDATLEQLKEVYKTCEAGHYAGGLVNETRISGLFSLIEKTVQEIERSFKK